MELIGGDTTGTAGLAGASPIRVRVTDSAGVALDGVPVRWSAPDGGSVVGPERTDSLGLASAEWTFGPRAGRQRLLAQVGNPRTALPLGITGVALPGAPAAITLDGGQGQRGIVGTPLGKPVIVTVRDSRGNPVPGVTVTPVPDKGGGAAEPGTTDARGRAALTWTLGTGAGEQVLWVRLAAVDSVLRVRATAGAALPARISIRALPGKAGVTEQRLEASVVDAHGNPVPGVYLAVSAGSGRLAATRVRSDQAGRAAIGWTPAKPGAESRLTVRLIGGNLKATHALGTK
jgi:adhesin/invasin